MEKFLGSPYPIIKNPHGFFKTQSGVSQIKSDLLVLLLTNPGERVFLPDFGTPLKELIFEPNDASLAAKAKSMIINSIKTWEPRIAVTDIQVSNNISKSDLDPYDAQEDIDNILNIKILFVDPEQIKEVQELRLQIPLA